MPIPGRSPRAKNARQGSFRSIRPCQRFHKGLFSQGCGPRKSAEGNDKL
jgi:hypothetical protein